MNGSKEVRSSLKTLGPYLGIDLSIDSCMSNELFQSSLQRLRDAASTWKTDRDLRISFRLPGLDQKATTMPVATRIKPITGVRSYSRLDTLSGRHELTTNRCSSEESLWISVQPLVRFYNYHTLSGQSLTSRRSRSRKRIPVLVRYVTKTIPNLTVSSPPPRSLVDDRCLWMTNTCLGLPKRRH